MGTLKYIQSFAKIIFKWINAHVYNTICGICAMVIGYLAPIQGIIQIMVLTILLDMIFGCVASFRRGEGIKSRKLWRTTYKIFYAILLVSLMFSIDKEMEQIQLHKTIAWIITGFEFWSILENITSITNLKVFHLLEHFMVDKVKDKTGVDISEDIK